MTWNESQDLRTKWCKNATIEDEMIKRWWIYKAEKDQM